MNVKCLISSALLSLLLSSATTSHSAESQLPDIGSSTSRSLSIGQEQALGDDYILAVRRLLPLSQDPLAVDYIKHLGFRIVEQNPDAQDRRFYFFIVDDPTLNAFALPGGYIGMHSGLMIAADTESELAGVMGHEVAHVTQRHLARRLERQRQLSFPSLAAFLGAILIATQNPQAGIGLATTANAGFRQALINHTRENEKEADRVGMQSVSRAGFDPLGVAGFFEKIQLSTRYLRRPPEFLMTHPVTQTRISDARARARQLPPPTKVDSLEFQLIKIRLAIRGEKQNRDRFDEKTRQYRADKAPSELAQYDFALRSQHHDNFEQAKSILNDLYKKRPDNLIYLVSLSEGYLAADQPEKAIPILEKELKNTPTSYPLIMTYARALINNKQPLAARAILLEHVYREDAEPQIFELLGEAQNLAGYSDEVHESRGQYLFATGDLTGALAQFDLAVKRQSDDPYALTRVQARIDLIQAILHERRNRR